MPRAQKQPRFRAVARAEPLLGVWRDSTSYSRDKERIPTTWTITLQPGFNITVTCGHIYHPGEWVMHCDPWFNARPIPADTAESAKLMALDIVAQKIDGLGRALLSLQQSKRD